MVTLSRVLCATDFSDGARHAMDHAVAIAKWYHARLSVLHVHRLHMPVYASPPMPMPAPVSPLVLAAEETEQLRRMLDGFVAVDRSSGICIETLLDEDFDVAGAILARAAALGADLIVLGTHGRSGFERFMIGSVAEKVLRKASCPVLIVPPRADSPSRPLSMRPRIVCAVDFSKASARALDYAASLARESDGVLTAVHVLDIPPESADPTLPDLSDYRAARFEEARLAMAGTVASLDEALQTVPLVVAGTPYREIVRLSREQQADLIVMGVQGRGAVDLAFFGSTAQHVVRQATCPVLTLKAA